MSAEADLYTTLSGDTSVMSLVDDRVYPDVVPQDRDLPAVAYSRVGTEYVNSIHGAALAQRATLEVFCMAARREDAEEICDAVSDAVRPSAFVTVGRRAEFDSEQLVWASVLTVDYWE